MPIFTDQNITTPSAEESRLDPLAYMETLASGHDQFGLVCIRPPEAPGGIFDSARVARRLMNFRTRQCYRQKVGRATESKDHVEVVNQEYVEGQRITLRDCHAIFKPEQPDDYPEVLSGPFDSTQDLLAAAATFKSPFVGQKLEKAECAVWKWIKEGKGALYSADNEVPAQSHRGTNSRRGAEALWDIANLGDTLCSLRKRNGVVMGGINTPYTYVGAAGSVFATHKEDFDLWSINVHLLGAEKIWYSVALKDVDKFERYCMQQFPEEYSSCEHFLRHKRFLFDPFVLARDAGITIYRTVQQPGDIVLTFPLGYHGGINLGFNVNEAINVALSDWPEYASRARTCDKEGHVNNPLCWETCSKIFGKHLGIELGHRTADDRMMHDHDGEEEEGSHGGGGER